MWTCGPLHTTINYGRALADHRQLYSYYTSAACGPSHVVLCMNLELQTLKIPLHYSLPASQTKLGWLGTRLPLRYMLGYEWLASFPGGPVTFSVARRLSCNRIGAGLGHEANEWLPSKSSIACMGKITVTELFTQ